ncbi:SufD family Fe-S cluster assembly protein, partial [bacterium]|nr:SufD family Fe-S cluster assembly protein [bacterium]
MMDLSSAATYLKEALQNPPSRKDEAWKYSDFQFLKKNTYSLSQVVAENTVVVIPEEKRIVITAAAPFESEWKYVTPVTGLAIQHEQSSQVWDYQNYFSKISEGLACPKTTFLFDESFDSDYLVELVLNPRETMASGYQFVPKNIEIVLKKNACVYLFEKSFLNQKQFVNINAQYFLNENSRLEMLKIEKGQIDGRGCQTSRFRLQASAQVNVTTATVGGEWSRHNVYAELAGEQASAQFLAASTLQNNEYSDHQTWIDHKVGETSSVQRYVNVLADEAHAVFNGKVHIHRDAQKSTAEQSNRNLLLSPKAHVDTKPELLIDADDVKAKHGATVGQINPDELFYLQ